MTSRVWGTSSDQLFALSNTGKRALRSPHAARPPEARAYGRARELSRGAFPGPGLVNRRRETGLVLPDSRRVEAVDTSVDRVRAGEPVSYTHLTLPTILLV